MKQLGPLRRSRLCVGAAARIFLLAVISHASCVAPPVEAGEAPVQVGQVADARLKELSGIVASRRNAGLYYVNNDSGDAARVYVITESGATRLTINLLGITSRDAEDIAVAPGASAGEFDVCLADIGDNDAKRKTVAIYRFPEPAIDPNGLAAIDVRPTTYTLSYNDGARNAEAFIVHPATGDAYVFTKRPEGGTDVYRLAAPWSATATNVLERVARLDLPTSAPLGRIVTAADIAPDGRRLVLRCYLNGFIWPLTDLAQTPFVEQISAQPTPISLAIEPQGEAVCFSRDGESVLTVSEGANPIVYSVKLAPTGE